MSDWEVWDWMPYQERRSRKEFVRPDWSENKSSDWEGKMGQAPIGTQYAFGIILTFIVIGFGLILTRGMLADPNLGGVIGTAADRETTKDIMILAVWGGILVPLSGLWSGIYESKQNEKASIPKMPVADRVGDYWKGGSSEPFDSSRSYETTSSEGTDQVLDTKDIQKQQRKPEDADFSYRGEFPERKRRGYDY